jgi:hypothetical protein
MYQRNTDLPSQVAKTDAKGFKIFNDTLEVIEVIEEPRLPVVTARMTPIKKLPRVLAHARADEAERRIIAELGVWRGFGAPEPWRQRLNVSAGGQGDEWERIRSEVLREVQTQRRTATKSLGNSGAEAVRVRSTGAPRAHPQGMGHGRRSLNSKIR